VEPEITPELARVPAARIEDAATVELELKLELASA